MNRPRPLVVETNAEGLPVAVRLPAGRADVQGRRAVEAVQETWRVDDEWWRQRPVSRLYHRVLLEDERVVTVYRDMVSDRWFKQSY